MRFGMGAGRWRTCPPPDTGRGKGPARYELSRSDDEGDCGRGRSERSERSSAGGWTPFRARVYEKGMTSSHIDFLVIPFFVARRRSSRRCRHFRTAREQNQPYRGAAFPEGPIYPSREQNTHSEGIICSLAVRSCRIVVQKCHATMQE